MSIRSMYPRLVVSDGAAAIDFYLAAFGAKEIERHGDPDTGKIVHAALAFGEFVIAVKDEDTDHPAPTSLGGSPVIIALDVDDADAVGAAMERAGATVIHPIQDWDYGQRAGRLADPYGHLWMISQPLP